MVDATNNDNPTQNNHEDEDVAAIVIDTGSYMMKGASKDLIRF